jgi:hypothetical protein
LAKPKVGNHRTSEKGVKVKHAPKEKRFDQLLQAMITQRVPGEKPVAKARTSASAASASYGDTRTREGKAASASSKPKRKPR